MHTQTQKQRHPRKHTHTHTTQADITQTHTHTRAQARARVEVIVVVATSESQCYTWCPRQLMFMKTTACANAISGSIWVGEIKTSRSYSTKSQTYLVDLCCIMMVKSKHVHQQVSNSFGWLVSAESSASNVSETLLDIILTSAHFAAALLFDDRTSFRTKRLRRTTRIAILPQFLTIEPHFREKAAPDASKLQFYLSFCRLNLISCEGLRRTRQNCNFTEVFADRTSFRAKRLHFVAPRWHYPAPWERNRKKEREEGKTARGQESKKARAQESKRRCEKISHVKVRWKDAKVRRCEGEKMWRCKMRWDEKMWRCEDVKMWRCEDVKMWRCEDVKMGWEDDVKMRRRCEDVKVRRCKDEKMRCEDVKMWRCEDEMRRCEDVKMWRYEDVKMRSCEDEKMRCEDVKIGLVDPTLYVSLDVCGKPAPGTITGAPDRSSWPAKARTKKQRANMKQLIPVYRC